TDDPAKVVAEMRKAKINDPMTENGWIREDGRVMRDFYVVQVKTPAESKYPWDYYKVIGKVAAEDARLPLSRRACNLGKKTNEHYGCVVFARGARMRRIGVLAAIVLAALSSVGFADVGTAGTLPQIAAGEAGSYLIKSDGSLWTWGDANTGERA